MISVSDSKHDCQILPKVDLPWRSSCHVFTLFFFMLNVTWHQSPELFCKENCNQSPELLLLLSTSAVLWNERFSRVFPQTLEEAAAQECPKKNNWSSSCTRMSQEKQLKQQLHKNVPRKTIEAAAAQECSKRNNWSSTAQECPKRNNWSSSCTRISTKTIEATTAQECPRIQLKQQLYKNFQGNTWSSTAQECPRRQLKQQLHKNAQENNRSCCCTTRVTKKTSVQPSHWRGGPQQPALLVNTVPPATTVNCWKIEHNNLIFLWEEKIKPLFLPTKW